MGSNYLVESNLRNNVREAISKRTQTSDCGWEQVGNLDLYFVRVKKIALGGAKGDVIVKLPVKCRFIQVASCTASNTNDSLFLHFNPLLRQYTGNAITLDGTEGWFPLCSVNANRTKVGLWYLFTKAMPEQIYLDIGQESGGGDYNITLAVGNDIEQLNLVTQP